MKRATEAGRRSVGVKVEGMGRRTSDVRRFSEVGRGAGVGLLGR